jgi:twitching motility protein PilT
MVDVFPAEQQQQVRVQLSSTLAAVIYQQLLPIRGGGRVAAFEVLLNTLAVQNLIKEAKTRQLRNVIATSSKEGMMTMEHSLRALIRSGMVEPGAAAAKSQYPQELKLSA